jgi:hypothetical protein
MIQSRVTQNSWPNETSWLNDNSAEDAREGETKDNGRECHAKFEAPSGIKPIEVSLFRQDIGTEPSQETEVGEDVDEDVLLYRLIRYCSLNARSSITYLVVEWTRVERNPRASHGETPVREDVLPCLTNRKS